MRYFDPDIGKVFCVMLSLKECSESSTGQNIFNVMNSELSHFMIPWENCLSFVADNASIMQGHRTGVASYMSKKAPAAYMLGCPCHLIHLAANKDASKLSLNSRRETNRSSFPSEILTIFNSQYALHYLQNIWILQLHSKSRVD